MRVVICGGGVIGACTAYFLSRRGIDVIVLEGLMSPPQHPARQAASWRWTGAPAARSMRWRGGSFALHAALPSEVAGDWGYRRMIAYSGSVVPEGDARRRVPADLDWLANGVVIASRLGTAETTAIVHPRAFTTAMMNAAQSHGAKVRSGRVTGIVRRADGSTVEGVEVNSGVIEVDAVVVAMGCFT